MNIILNPGLNDTIVLGFQPKTVKEKFSYDSYTIPSKFSRILLWKYQYWFRKSFSRFKDKVGVKLDIELKTEDLKEKKSA